MTDMQGLRAQLRDTRATPASQASSGGIPFWLIAAGAAALGFAIVLFTPRFYTTQRTAVLPVAQAAHRAEPAEGAPQAVAPEPSGASARYAGKTPEEVVRTVEIVCDERARVLRNGPAPARPPVSAASRAERDLAQARQVADDLVNGAKITAADEKLHCFLTEAPARFCAPNLKRKATADIINYFKGIEYTNTAVAVVGKLQGAKPEGAFPPSGPKDLPLNVAGKVTVDPRVVEAIEGLMRAGYLTKAHRDDIAANVPRDVKERFARIVGSTPACPKPPWWSMFL